MASSDAFSELPNFALEGDFPEDVELIPTQQLFFSNALNVPVMNSCNNVAPVTNLCLGRATTRSHSSQWSKKKVAVET